jgi:hypothetical protein
VSLLPLFTCAYASRQASHLRYQYGCRQVNALGQADGLIIAFKNDGRGFHAVKLVGIPVETKPGNNVLSSPRLCRELV